MNTLKEYCNNENDAKIIHEYIFQPLVDKYSNQNLLVKLYKFKVRQVIDYIIDYKYKDVKEVLSYIDNSFNSECWDLYKNEEKKRSKVTTKCEPNCSKICKKCNKKSIFVYEMQLRSIDEATTNIYTCTICSHTWKEH